MLESRQKRLATASTAANLRRPRGRHNAAEARHHDADGRRHRAPALNSNGKPIHWSEEGSGISGGGSATAKVVVDKGRADSRWWWYRLGQPKGFWFIDIQEDFAGASSRRRYSNPIRGSFTKRSEPPKTLAMGILKSVRPLGFLGVHKNRRCWRMANCRFLIRKVGTLQIVRSGGATGRIGDAQVGNGQNPTGHRSVQTA